MWWDVSGTDVQWWESHGTAVGDVTSLAVPAQYVIEQYRLVSDGESVDVNGRLQPILAFHRITAIGIGRRVTNRVRVQSTFARRYERLNDDDQFVNVDSADRVVERGAVKGEGPLHSLGADLASRIGDTPTRRNNALFGRQSWRLLD